MTMRKRFELTQKVRERFVATLRKAATSQDASGRELLSVLADRLEEQGVVEDEEFEARLTELSPAARIQPRGEASKSATVSRDPITGEPAGRLINPPWLDPADKGI